METEGAGAIVGEGGLVGAGSKVSGREHLAEDMEEIGSGPAGPIEEGPKFDEGEVEPLGGPRSRLGQGT